MVQKQLPDLDPIPGIPTEKKENRSSKFWISFGINKKVSTTVISDHVTDQCKQ